MIRKWLGIASALSIAVGLGTAPAHAQNTRSFVSSEGADTNPCSAAAPCRSFQHAHDMTDVGGEIVVLNSAGYGSVTISKSITINSIGVEGAITGTPGGTAITITAGTGSSVRLHDLTLIGQGTGATGISITGGAAVFIDACSINGFTGDGISYVPNTSGTLTVDAQSINNGGNGVTVAPTGTSGAWSASIGGYFAGNTETGILFNGAGATGTLGGFVSAHARGNGTGIEATSAAGAAATIVMVANGAHANFNTGPGVQANGTATVYVDRLQATGNNLGWSATNGGTMKSYGDNEINGNTTDTTMPKLSEE